MTAPCSYFYHEWWIRGDKETTVALVVRAESEATEVPKEYFSKQIPITRQASKLIIKQVTYTYLK